MTKNTASGAYHRVEHLKVLHLGRLWDRPMAVKNDRKMLLLKFRECLENE